MTDVRRAVVKLSLKGEILQIYPSGIDAAVSLGSRVISSSIAKVCKGHRKTCYKYKWRYATDEEEKEVKQPPKGGKVHKKFSNYVIYPDGKIFSTISGSYMKQLSYCGYRSIHLISSDGSRYSCLVHRLVAQTYIKAPSKEQIYVNHIDGNKSNNNVSNLEWCTQSENIKHAHDNSLIAGPSCVSKQDRIKDSNSDEQWKQIEDTPYEVSNMGRIYSNVSKRILKLFKRGSGYIICTLQCVVNIKPNQYVHRLVAIAFLGRAPEDIVNPVVNHIDGNRSNNQVSNLEWISSKQNAQLAFLPGGGRKTKRVVQYTLDGKKIATYQSAIEAADKIKISYTSIWSACTGRAKTAAGYKWKYKV